MSIDDAHLEILMTIKGDLGEVKGMLAASNAIMAQHIIDDKALIERVGGLEVSHAKAKGYNRALMGVGSVLAGGVGALVHRLLK